jgi:tRNA (guanine-N7-)-methyltransferase
MVHHLTNFPLFERITEQELEGDQVLEAARTATEEGRKVERNKGEKYVACFRRIVLNR